MAPPGDCRPPLRRRDDDHPDRAAGGHRHAGRRGDPPGPRQTSTPRTGVLCAGTQVRQVARAAAAPHHARRARRLPAPPRPAGRRGRARRRCSSPPPARGCLYCNVQHLRAAGARRPGSSRALGPAGRAFTTCATPSRCSTLLAGTAPAATSQARLPLLSTYLGHVDPRRDLLVPLGRARAARARRRATRRATGGAGHERARADPAGLLHRPARPPAPRQPAHDRRLPRHLAPAARLRRRHAPAGSPPTLDSSDLDAPLVGAFLDHLEQERGNSVRTRNARLAAIRSLFRYAALRHPEHAALIARVLAIPPKRFERALVTFLTEPEVDALLARPDRTTWIGRRDHALLLLAVQTGLRVSELTGLRCGDVQLGTAPTSAAGQGSKAARHAADQPRPSRCCAPGWPSAPAGPNDPLFPDPPRPAAQPRRGRAAARQARRHRRRTLARRWRPKRSPRTSCATPPRCACCTPASTPP